MPPEKTISLDQLVDLRIAVLALGEIQSFGWWKSQFLSQTGISFLDRVFPRTKFANAVRSASRVAQLAHDAYIGRGDIIHLFRLPFLETEIDKYLSSNGKKLEQMYAPIINNRELVSEHLSSMANGVSFLKQAGPVRLPTSELGNFQLLAAIYLQGFLSQSPVFPYFLD